MEVQIITQGASLERQLRIKKKKIKDATIDNKEESQKEVPPLEVPRINEPSINEKSSNEPGSSSDEDELISFTSNYDFIKHKKNLTNNLTSNSVHGNEKYNQSEYLNESTEKSNIYILGFCC